MVLENPIAGIALFIMNRPEAKNAMSKNFLNLVSIINFDHILESSLTKNSF